MPSGLFPSGPPRPTYREPNRVRAGAVSVGFGAAALWMLLFGLLGHGLRGYAWWTLLAGGAAWLLAVALARFGDRGVAAGIAVAVGLAGAIAAIAVATRWANTGVWPMW
jgi:membrane-bound ClpP family serine protease